MKSFKVMEKTLYKKERRWFFDPVFLLGLVWFVQVSLYSFRLANFLPWGGEAFLAVAKLFALSMGGVLLGRLFFLFLKEIGRRSKPHGISSRFRDIQMGEVEIKKVRSFVFLMVAVILVVTVYNLLKHGPLPLVSLVFGLQVDSNYMDYGQMKYFVYGPALIVFVLVRFEENVHLRRVFFSFAFIVLLFYVSRGFLIIGLASWGLMKIYAQAQGMGFKRIVIFLVGFMFSVSLLMSLVGAVRTGSDAFKVAMGISGEYWSWPVGLLWVISYISFPLANIITLELDQSGGAFGGMVSLYSSVPPFLWGVLDVRGVGEDLAGFIATVYPNPLNTVATYLGVPFLDFGYFGIISFNLVYGFVISFAQWKYFVSKNVAYAVLYVILLQIVFFSFFDNIFINISIIIEIFLGMAFLVHVKYKFKVV